MTFNNRTTAVEAATVLRDQVKGKNIVVTGVSPNSLGAETVKALAPYAKTIIVASRSTERAEQATAEIRKAWPNVDIKVVALDLLSGDSIRSAAAKINAFGLPIHVLINNAAVAHFSTVTRTKEGFEAQLGANHFGHFLFTSLLFPSILAAKSDDWSPRVVVLSSLAASFPGGALKFDDLQYELRPEEYNKHIVYGQTKTANALFAAELARRYKDAGVLSFAVHPGVIRATNMGVATPEEDMIAWGILKPDGTPADPEMHKDIAQGTSTQIIGAFDPSLKDHSGAFLNDGIVFPGQLPDWMTSEEAAKNLWELSEKAWGIKFGA